MICANLEANNRVQDVTGVLPMVMLLINAPNSSEVHFTYMEYTVCCDKIGESAALIIASFPSKPVL